MANPKQEYQSNFQAALFALTLERKGHSPLHAQLSEALRALMASGRYGGLRVPASRAFAAELSVSRMTVTTAYDQLIAEGYLIARRGAGTYVAQHMPHLAPPVPRPDIPAEAAQPILPFHPGVPDQSSFPHRIWAKHLERAWQAPHADLLMRPELFGWPPLRRAIAEHLNAWRGLDCAPDQIVITAGAWDAFDILKVAVMASVGRLAMEDPGWPTLRKLAAQAGVDPMLIRIDADGLDPARIPPDVTTLIVTPSRHYPTGVAMPLVRRLALLHWARTRGGLIIEDDYDSEFRYQGQPLPSLSGLDGLRRTLYMGSFSKLLSPSLRIGYLVLPEAFIVPVRSYLSVTGARASLLPQPALARFLQSGEFAAHLRRMRRIYARRQDWLLRELAPAADLLALRADPSGMHLVAGLQPDLAGRASDRDIARLGDARGLSLRALSSHSGLPNPPEGLLLGYAAFDEDQLSDAAQRLIALLRQVAGG